MVWLNIGSASGVNSFTTVQPVGSVQTPSQSGAGSRQIYASSSTGNDTTGDGTIGNPYATAAKGATKIRTGFSDQLFLKCGDTFVNDTINDVGGRFRQSGIAPTITSGSYVSGATLSGPILIASYGAGARPIMSYRTVGSTSGVFLTSLADTDGMNIVIQGIDIEADGRNPSSGSYVGATAAAADAGTYGLFWGTGGSGYASGSLVLIEDCIVNFFTTNIIFQNPTTGTSPNVVPVVFDGDVVLRRDIIANAYNGNGGHSQGMGGTVGIKRLTLVENLWDHNGWCEDATLLAKTPGTGATIFNRNLYDGNEGLTQLTTVTRISIGEIHARGSSNTQWRSGCNLSDGLFLANCVQGFDLGENKGTDSQSASINNNTPGPYLVQRCVVLLSKGIASSNASAAQAGGGGIQLANIQSVALDKIIVAWCDTSSTNSVAVSWDSANISGNNTVAGNIITGLIAYKIKVSYTNTSQAAAVDTTSGTNFLDLTGTNSGSSPEPFPHPNPTGADLIADYLTSIGASGDYTTFLATCAARAGGTWDRRYSAYGANQYVQQTGYGTAYHS